MINILRQMIMDQLYKVRGGITNIIFNLMQHQMKYNPFTDKFEMQLRDVNKQTTYFLEHPYEKRGMVDGTNIYWGIFDDKFAVWMDH